MSSAFLHTDKSNSTFTAFIFDPAVLAFVSVIDLTAVWAEHRIQFPNIFHSAITSL